MEDSDSSMEGPDSPVSMDPESISEEEESGTDDQNYSDYEHEENEIEKETENIEKNNVVDLYDKHNTSQSRKCLSVKNQLTVWEMLLEVRIQLQKCLVLANNMPQKEKIIELKNQCSEFNEKITDTRNSLSYLLDELLALQTLFLKNNPETKNLATDKEEATGSDSTQDSNKNAGGDAESIQKVVYKKRRLCQYEGNIAQLFHGYKDHRNKVIHTWNQKTSIGRIKLNTPSYSVLDQIEYSLSDRSRLAEHAQHKNVSSNTEDQEENDDSTQTKTNVYEEKYNNNIFDDGDFYHQLLREFIEVKSSDMTDPVQIGRQWLQLKNIRNKMKRNVDTRATKGRKLRYAVHSKLINTMAPIDNTSYTNEAINEIYSSLFGKKHV